jgi:hypothetical protein
MTIAFPYADKVREHSDRAGHRSSLSFQKRALLITAQMAKRAMIIASCSIHKTKVRNVQLAVLP